MIDNGHDLPWEEFKLSGNHEARIFFIYTLRLFITYKQFDQNTKIL